MAYGNVSCEKCGTLVAEGPQGGYVCGVCLYTAEPSGYEQRRRDGLARVAAEREARTLARREAAAAAAAQQ